MAKYEMKVADNSGNAVFDGTNGGVPLDVTLYKPESRPGGVPWVRITHTDTIAECATLGTGYHLMTAKEWAAVARNIEAVASNWRGNSVGSGKEQKRTWTPSTGEESWLTPVTARFRCVMTP